MKKTLLCHFYNEEYLLPWFLNHHKNIFDHGIMIDYHSTDRSVEIIKEICPTWEIVKSRNEKFGAEQVDDEVMDIERSIDGWRICLNVTEHLIGNYDVLDDQSEKQILIPSFVFVDTDPENLPSYDKSLYEQKTMGFFGAAEPIERLSRSIHNYPVFYDWIGRHFGEFHYPVELAIFYWGWCPWNNYQLQRKLQIKTQMPQSDILSGKGAHHLAGKDEFEKIFEDRFIRRSYNLSKEIENFVAHHKRYTE